jgi:hypothetical protein
MTMASPNFLVIEAKVLLEHFLSKAENTSRVKLREHGAQWRQLSREELMGFFFIRKWLITFLQLFGG